MDYNEQVLSNVDIQRKIYIQFHLYLYIQPIYVNLHVRYNPKTNKKSKKKKIFIILGLYLS